MSAKYVEDDRQAVREHLWPKVWHVVVLSIICLWATASPSLLNSRAVSLSSLPSTMPMSTPQHQQQAVWDLQELDALQRLVQEEIRAVGQQYASCPVCNGSRSTALQLLQQHVRVNALAGALAQHLTLSYQNKAQLLLAVTGGSSSAGKMSWPGKLLDKLKALQLFKVKLRNAAQGATSQLVTAPCVHTLVGDNVDVLFWEFAMNDEYPTVIEKLTSERVRLAETWIRSAAHLKPKALGFVHYHDISIQSWKVGQPHPPDRAWVPTNYAADHVLRGQGIDAFSVNMFGILTSGIIPVSDKKSFLKDHHHPNDIAFNITADVLKLGVLRVWQMGLEMMVGTRQPQMLQQSPQPLLQPGLLVPALHQTSACYLTGKPQFGTAKPSLRLQRCASRPALQGKGCELQPYGKAAADRYDRKARLLVPACNTDGVRFAINASQPLTSLWLGCGLQQSCEGINVYLDGSRVQANIDTGDDMLRYFFPWVFNITHEPFRHARELMLCRDARIDTTNVSLSHMIIWMQHQHP